MRKYIKILYTIQILFFITFCYSNLPAHAIICDPPVYFFETHAEAQAAKEANTSWSGTWQSCWSVLYDTTEWNFEGMSGWYHVVNSSYPLKLYVYAKTPAIWDAYVLSTNDDDDDGLCNNLDLYPDDATPYLTTIVSRQQDSNGNYVYWTLDTSRGDRFNYGVHCDTCRTWLGVAGDSDLTQSDIALMFGGCAASSSADVTQNNNDDLPGGTVVVDSPNDPTPFDDPTGGDDPGSSPGTGSDTDNVALNQITANTHASNQNMSNMTDYLARINKNLSDMNIRDGQAVASPGTSTNVTVNFPEDFPTAGEIGTAVDEQLIDPTQTYDNTGTNDIGVYNPNNLITESASRYSTRITTFTDTIKNSALYTLPGDLIGDIPTGGTSDLSLNVGQWGSVAMNTHTFDLSNYNVAWTTLRYVFMILTAFAIVRVIILKQG